ncbi:MAG: type IV pilin N-terminal domain-containing protein [Methanomicrobiales archaeon]
MNENRMAVEREYAVSPVAGVMLMLLLPIIIAAVVSAFAVGRAPARRRLHRHRSM